MIEYKELEYKYRADQTKLTDFIDLAESLSPIKKLDTSSWDVYFTTDKNENTFLRYRESTEPELTSKEKVKNTNNWERIEIDLPLDPRRITEKIVTAFVNGLGFKKNFKIYKSCFIYWLDNTNMVYYTVYDEEMKEIGRYIEVEVNKDKLKDIGQEQAMQELYELEKKLESLNITAKNRMKRSLFEIYRN